MEQSPYLGRGFFVGREQELEEVEEYLSLGESALLIGGRRTGKTTLAEQIGDIGRPIHRVHAAAWRSDNEKNSIRAFSHLIGCDCNSREELTAALEKYAPIALVMDEADLILAEPWAGSFLSYLRYLIDTKIRNGLAILMIGGPALNRYANPDDKGSPPLNLATKVYLQPLTRDARRKLAAPLATTPDHEWLDRYAGGHPWLLKGLLQQLWKGASKEEAREKVFANGLANFEIWKRQLGPEGLKFLRALPPEGIDKTTLWNDHTWRKYLPAAVIAKSLCLIDIDDREHVLPGPALFLDWLDETPSEDEWDLAISYASEDVKIASEVAHGLREDFRVFFAPDQSAYLWGDDLNRVLPHTYGVNARYVLVISSDAYIKKHWTLLEWEAALKGRPGRTLMLSMAGVLPPNVPESLVYRVASPEALISLLSDLRKRLAKA
jgi:hypothetical protein